ncbi:MAG TPA: hypothetical protein VH165_34940 [Kofleriaceae bacterium]|nr:hypothetical protein [Kofleriaceae bacterium]
MNPRYVAKPFKPGIQQQGWGAAVDTPAHAWYVTRGVHSELSALSFDKAFIAAQDFRNERAWRTGAIVPRGAAQPALTPTRPAAVATRSAFYIFWVDATGRAIRAVADDGAGGWSSAVAVYTPKANYGGLAFKNEPLVQSEIAAYEMGDLVVLSWIQGDQLCSMLLDPAGIAGDGVWTGGRIAVLPLAKLGLTADHTALSTTWISQGGDARWMAVASFAPSLGKQRCAASLISLDDDGLPSGKRVLPLKDFSDVKQGGVSLVRPTTGELRAYWVDDNGQARVKILLTYQKFDKLVDADGRVAWSSNHLVQRDPYVDDPFRGADPPTFAQTVGPPRDDLDPKQTPTTAYDVYGLTFYTEPSEQDTKPVWVAIAREGAVQVVVNQEAVPPLKGEDTPAIALTGVFDAPMPLPGQNLIGSARAMAGEPLCTVEYGHTELVSNEHASSIHTTMGVETEGIWAVGVGLAWRASLEAGLGRKLVTRDSEHMQTARTAKTWIEIRDDDTLAVAESSLMLGAHLALVQQLAAFVNVDNRLETVTMQVGGDKVEQPKYPPAALLGAASRGGVSGGFTPFSVVPGDLYSYTPDDMDRRIANRFAELTPDQQRALAGAGDAYTGGYATWLDAQAVPLGQHRKYLEIITQNAGGQATSYEVSNTRFQEWQWDFASELYAGLALHFEFWGAKLEASFLVGSKVQLETRTSVETQRRWGISADVEFPPGVEPGQVTGYTTRLYLLPADARWTKEILYMSERKDGPIDPNGAPWRICFLVDPLSIKFQPGKLRGEITRLEEPTATFSQRKLGVRSAQLGGTGVGRYRVHGDAELSINGKPGAAWSELQKQDPVTISLDSGGVTHIDVQR